MTGEQLQELASKMGRGEPFECDPNEVGVIVICVDKNTRLVGWVSSIADHEVTNILASMMAKRTN